MSVKTRIAVLSLAVVSCFGAGRALGQLLPGNVWPNPVLSTPSPAGVDQVYSYYNGTYSSGGPYVPNVTGDSNPSPNGWHRGGSDFGVTTLPSFCFYNTPGNAAAEGTAPAGSSSGYALEVNDTSTGGYGEWFSDWNALPVTAGTPFAFRFFYEITNVHSTARPENSDQFRISADFADSVGNDTLTAPNQIGPSTDFIIPGGSSDVTSWMEGDETLIAPAGAQSMRVTIDSGGSSQATGQIWVENISVAAVPEPTSIAIVGAGAMCLAARRRRRA
jgi:hypothetical protein